MPMYKGWGEHSPVTTGALVGLAPKQVPSPHKSKYEIL